MANIIASLTTRGYITDKNLIMNKLLLYYKTSLFNQSTLNFGNITSLLHTLEISKDESELRSRIVDDLTNLYNQYFTSSEVNVNFLDKKNDSYDIEISIKCKDDDNNAYDIIDKTSTDEISMAKFSDTLNKFKKDF